MPANHGAALVQDKMSDQLQSVKWAERLLRKTSIDTYVTI